MTTPFWFLFALSAYQTWAFRKSISILEDRVYDLEMRTGVRPDKFRE